MRVSVSDPDLLRDLCDYLSRRGCMCVEATYDEADVLMPGASSSFEAATMLLAHVDLWRATRRWVKVDVHPDPML